MEFIPKNNHFLQSSPLLSKMDNTKNNIELFNKAMQQIKKTTSNIITNNIKTSILKIGTKVKVFSELNEEFHQGTISEYSPQKNEYQIFFDDGDISWVMAKNIEVLTQEDYKEKKKKKKNF